MCYIAVFPISHTAVLKSSWITYKILAEVLGNYKDTYHQWRLWF